MNGNGTMVGRRHAIEMRTGADEIDADARRFCERHGFANAGPGTDSRTLCYLKDLGNTEPSGP